MGDPGDQQDGVGILRLLRALAHARQARGDGRLLLSPDPEPQEYRFSDHDIEASEATGLVLEPKEGAPFETKPVWPRRNVVRIGGFCDGTRATHFLGFDDVYPLLYTENRAAVRLRDGRTGYHAAFRGIEHGQTTLLAPFKLLPPDVRLAYDRLGLIPTPHADLCWFGDENEESAAVPHGMEEMRRFGSVVWQAHGRRRSRRLMEVSEQIVALAAAEVLHERGDGGEEWLLKDGSLFQFDRHLLKAHRNRLRRVVACVKTHPVPFFGVEGERLLAGMHVGERSVAFLPRPPKQAGGDHQPSRLEESPRPMACWYLRVREPTPGNPNRLSGVVRLDIAVVDGWPGWVDEVSWAVLDEYYGLSARPDPQHDVTAYGICECEHYLLSRRLPGNLLLAALAT